MSFPYSRKILKVLTYHHELTNEYDFIHVLKKIVWKINVLIKKTDILYDNLSFKYYTVYRLVIVLLYTRCSN